MTASVEKWKREMKEVPITEDDIIYVLQRYKPAIAKIFQKPVDLWVDNEGEIHVKTVLGEMSLEPIVNTSLKVVGFEELKRPVTIVKLVEEWWEYLTPQQRKALFYRYVNHDMAYGWPKYLDDEDFRVKYHTRSEREVAKLLNISKTAVRDIIDRALKKLMELLG